MTTVRDYQQLLDRIGALRETMADRLGSQLIQTPELADEIVRQIDDLLAGAVAQDQQVASPPDYGLGELAGIGPEAADELGDTYLTPVIEPYDETVTSERILAVGDLYYIYQHEKVGIFRAILKLQELFRAGTVRLSSGRGAFGLYQYDRRQVLRHTHRDRMQAYRRVFGYTRATPPPGAQPNRDFHTLFVHFMNQVAQFYRDKRIAYVIRPQSDRTSFGSVAVVRRSGLDLRNNLKSASYGHVIVLRVELLQLLEEAFDVLGSPDVKKLFGADHAWDVVEEINKRYLDIPQINVSQRSRMAVAGRDILRWLAHGHVLNATRAEFEALLQDIADEAEEWLTSAEALGMTPPQRVHVVENGRSRRSREVEWETFG